MARWGSSWYNTERAIQQKRAASETRRPPSHLSSTYSPPHSHPEILELVLKGCEIQTSPFLNTIPDPHASRSLSWFLNRSHISPFAVTMLSPPREQSKGNHPLSPLFTANIPTFRSLLPPFTLRSFPPWSVSFPLLKPHHFSPFPSFPDSPLPLSHSSSTATATASNQILSSASLLEQFSQHHHFSGLCSLHTKTHCSALAESSPSKTNIDYQLLGHLIF